MKRRPTITLKTIDGKSVVRDLETMQEPPLKYNRPETPIPASIALAGYYEFLGYAIPYLLACDIDFIVSQKDF